MPTSDLLSAPRGFAPRVAPRFPPIDSGLHLSFGGQLGVQSPPLDQETPGLTGVSSIPALEEARLSVVSPILGIHS